MVKGIVTDIQRMSVHDGPGIRTTVFLKGCPLNCSWCHNPECIEFQPQMMYYPEKCMGCDCCDKGCFSGARVICGKEMSVQEVIKEVLLDKDYYGEDGGITISGGEPFAQPSFLSALIDGCKEHEIHCAVESSLFYFDEEIFRKLDLCMADMKIWDNDLHKKYTGVENVRIKKNFKRLNEIGIPIIGRTPVIPGIPQGIEEISGFLVKLDSVKKYELLPYHPLGDSKREALGLSAETFTIPSAEYMKELEKYVFIR